MKTIKEEVAKITATGSAGAGLVEATVNGEFTLLSIKISDSAMAMNDKNALEVLIVSAVNDANEKVKAETANYTTELMTKLGRK